MNNIEKTHSAASRIIEVLKILLETDSDIDSIKVKIGENKDITNAKTNEAYYKYFNTFEALGFNIIKINGKYCLMNALSVLELTKEEEKLLYKLIMSIPKLHNGKCESTIENFILRLDKYVSINLRSIIQEMQHFRYENYEKKEMLNNLQHIMEENEEVSIVFKNYYKENLFDVAIKKIKEEKGHFYIICYNSDMQRNRKISIDSISEIKRSPKIVSNMENNTSVIFEVYDRLSKSYKIKPWETLIDFGDGYTRILNTQEDIDTLMLRLLKYGENCKIIHPKNIADDFLSLTDDILRNLEGKNV